MCIFTLTSSPKTARSGTTWVSASIVCCRADRAARRFDEENTTLRERHYQATDGFQHRCPECRRFSRSEQHMSVETVWVQDLFSRTRWVRNSVRAWTSWPETRSRSGVPKKSRPFFVPDVSNQTWVSSHCPSIRRCQLHSSMYASTPEKDWPKFDSVELVSACCADTDTTTQAHHVRPCTLDFFGEVWSRAGPVTWTPPRPDKVLRTSVTTPSSSWWSWIPMHQLEPTRRPQDPCLHCGTHCRTAPSVHSDGKLPEFDVEGGGVASNNAVVEDETDKLWRVVFAARLVLESAQAVQAQIARNLIVCRSARTSVTTWVPPLTGVTGHRHVMVNQPLSLPFSPSSQPLFFFESEVMLRVPRSEFCLCQLRGPWVAPQHVCSRTSSDDPPARPKRPSSSHGFHH